MGSSSGEQSPELMSYGDFQKLAQPAAPRTIMYGADPLQHVELWTPAGCGPFPVVIVIHGGCWQTAIAKADIMHRVAQALACRGVVAWNIEYRGIDVAGGGYPGTFEDVAAAADMVGTRANQYNLDPQNVVAVGHSAGAHLALWLAGRGRIEADSSLRAECPQRLRGVVALGGLHDLEEARTRAAEACGGDTVDRLVGRATAKHPDPFGDTSPVSLLPVGIPQVLISGSADTIAPPQFASDYAGKAVASGDKLTTRTIESQGHFELITPGTTAGDAAIDAVLALVQNDAALTP